MGFLSSKNINLLNIHASIIRLIDLMAWTFGAVFFYEIGIPLPYIFFIIAGVNFLRIPLRFLLIPVIEKIGLRSALASATFIYGLTPLLLTKIGGLDGWLVAYVFVSAGVSAFYWTSFHVYYTLAGNADHRGKHFAVMEAAKWCVTALAPYLSGVFIEFEDFTVYFYLVIPLMLCAVLPLFFCQPISLSVDRKAWRQEFLTFGGKSHFMQVLIVDTQSLCWIFMVFFALGKISHFGAVLSIGMLAQALVQLGLGWLMDKGHLWRIFVLGCLMVTISIIAMSTTTLTFINAAVLDALFAFSLIHLSSGFSVSLYNDAHRTSNTLWYWIFSEFWVDVAACIAKGGAGMALLLGAPLNQVLLGALCGVAGLYLVMKQHFKVCKAPD